MGAMIGLVIGYVMGTRAGEEGWTDFREAWRTISSAEEVRDMVAGGLSMAADLVQRGSGLLTERLEKPETGAKLRRVA